jgi:hypothetical protein
MGVIKVGFLALLARLGLVEQELVDKTARQVLMAQCTAVNVEADFDFDDHALPFGAKVDDMDPTDPRSLLFQVMQEYDRSLDNGQQ